MQKQGLIVRSNDFVQSVLLIEIGIFSTVGLLCYGLGARSVREYGLTLLVAALGAAVMGVLRVKHSAAMSWAREYQREVSVFNRTGGGQMQQAMALAQVDYRFFWLMTTVAVMTFVAGAILEFS